MAPVQLYKSEGFLPVKDGAVSAEEGCSQASRDWQTAASSELMFSSCSAPLPWERSRWLLATASALPRNRQNILASLTKHPPTHTHHPLKIAFGTNNDRVGWMVRSALPFPIQPVPREALWWCQGHRGWQVSASRCVSSAAPWQDGTSGQLAESQGYLMKS